jgi:ATP-dependent RNA helicase DOB1
LDPIADIRIKDENFRKLLGKIDVIEERLRDSPLNGSERLPGLYQKYEEKLGLVSRIDGVKRQIQQATSILQMDDLKSRKRVLRRLEFTDANDVILMKGRVACEISTGDELLLTEMIFNGAFNDLGVDQTVALLSCFVFQEKSDESVRLKDELAKPLRMMQEAARRIAQVSIECKLPLNEEEYVASFRPELMDVVYAWCQGSKFYQICKMTDVFEGSIIRAMRRLEELLRQMSQAAKSMGNSELENKFAQGINRIKRDIVFANSLYL